MSSASTEGPALQTVTEEEIVDSYTHNDEVLDQAFETALSKLAPDQVEDIIERAASVRTTMGEREAKTQPLRKEPLTETPQIRAPEVPKRKAGRMMARLPPAQPQTMLPAAVPASALPDKNVAGEKRDEEHDTTPADPIPDKNVLGELRNQEAERPAPVVDVPSTKFGSPQISDSWNEDIDVADSHMGYPETPDEQGGLYGVSDPILSTTSMHLSDLRSEIDVKLDGFAQALREINQEINRSQTKVLDRIRALERKLAHDPPLSVAASKLNTLASRPTEEVDSKEKQPRVSLADRIKQRNA